MSIIVFVGPSLPVEIACTLLPADYRPPAKAGDLHAATLEHPEAIGLIDGYFEAVPAVWHKEILYALHSGIPVYGASSMGALRAAELCSFGMTGVGEIFDCYANGVYEDDDEVALLHAPQALGYQSLSEPMVNIRSALRRAADLNLMSQATYQALIRLAKAQFYPQRTWARLSELGLASALPTNEITQLLNFVMQEKPDQKRDDARQMLEQMAKDQMQGLKRHEPKFEFENSIFFHRLKASVRRDRSNNH